MSVGQLTVGSNPQAAIKRSLRLAMSLLLFLVVGMGGMAAFIHINGAVIAPGQVAVASEVKKVQHPTGGVVSEIRVQDGSRVRAGDILLSLDPTASEANASIVGSAVDQLTARQARLEAERDSRAIRFPPDLLARKSQPGVAGILGDEQRLYKLRADTRAGQRAQLGERQAQLRQEIDGYQQESDAKQKQIALIESELIGVRQLYVQKLVPLTRLNGLERDAVQLRGDVAQIAATVAEAKGKISEIQLQIIQIDQDARSQAGNELTDVQNRLSDLKQRKVAADQDYKRIVIRAPQSGVVDRLAIHTIGGVIAPGEAILYIVPDRDRLHVEAKIRTSDIDEVTKGQTASLRFSAFNMRTTPEIRGLVSDVSADAHTEERTGVSYYVATIDIPEDQLKRLKGLLLVPGMPVESFIQTRPRSMLSYVTKPLANQFRRSFREG